MVVPNTRNDPRSYAERLGPHDVVYTRLHGRPLTVLVEPARLGATYGCGPSDVIHLLDQVPKPDLDGLDLVVFRQPTRKEEMLVPVWGRCLFRADFGRHKGSAILLEAVHLRSHKQKVSATVLTEAAVRDTLLYHTLLHEIGHWVDWQKRVRRPALKAHSRAKSDLVAAYFARPLAERETAAERYANRQATRLRAAGLIPFAPLD